jgi:deoxyadenosine/deoxycytidine kinase
MNRLKATAIIVVFLLTLPIQAKLILFIEGSSGAGKTTLSRLLERELDAHVILEPFDKWCAIGNHGNLFKHFLEDTARWAYTFQSYVFFTHLQTFKEVQESSKEIFVMDRSLYSGFHTFVPLLHKDGLLTDMEYYLYNETCRWLLKEFPCQPDGIIYLRTSPEVCLERALKRNRLDQKDIDFKRKLHDMHEQWLMKKHNFEYDVPTLIIDGNMDFKDENDAQWAIVAQIRAFIDQLRINSN